MPNSKQAEIVYKTDPDFFVCELVSGGQINDFWLFTHYIYEFLGLSNFDETEELLK